MKTSSNHARFSRHSFIHKAKVVRGAEHNYANFRKTCLTDEMLLCIGNIEKST